MSKINSVWQCCGDTAECTIGSHNCDINADCIEQWDNATDYYNYIQGELCYLRKFCFHFKPSA